MTEEKSHAIALSLNKAVYISLAQTCSISGWLSDSGPEKFYPVSKSVLKSVDFLHIINAFTCFISIDLYYDLNKKFKNYKLLLLLQRQMMVPPVFFKLVSIVRVSMSPVSNGSYRSTDNPFYNFNGSYRSTDNPFYNFKAKHLPN